MIIYIGADHRGFKMKEKLTAFLKEIKVEVAVKSFAAVAKKDEEGLPSNPDRPCSLLPGGFPNLFSRYLDSGRLLKANSFL